MKKPESYYATIRTVTPSYPDGTHSSISTEIKEFAPDTPIHQVYEWYYRIRATAGQAGDLRIVAKESADAKE